MKRAESKSCRRIDMAAAWASGGLTQRQRELFGAHLDKCPECRSEVDSLQKTLLLLQEAPQAVASGELTTRIMGAVAREARLERRELRLQPAPLWWSAAAALLLICLLPLAHHVMHGTADGEVVVVENTKQQQELALDWLAAQQESDGTWRPMRTGGNDAYRPAVTALALLALQSQAPERYETAVEAAVAALVALQTPEGAFCRTSGAELYNQAFVTYALLHLPDEVLSRSKVHAACSRAIDFSRTRQTAQGAWDYGREGSGNTALTSWQLAVLTKAKERGWNDDGGHLRRGLAWLRQQSDGHEFGYRQPGIAVAGHGRVTLTAMAATSLIEGAHLYQALSDDATAAVAMLYDLMGRVQSDGSDYYRDYFLARVSTLTGDSVARREVERRLAGNYESRLGHEGAHWPALDQWGRSGGDVYATAMAVLSF